MGEDLLNIELNKWIPSVKSNVGRLGDDEYCDDGDDGINDARNSSLWGQTRWFSWDGNVYDDQDDHQDVHDDNDDDWSNVVCGQTR